MFQLDLIEIDRLRLDEEDNNSTQYIKISDKLKSIIKDNFIINSLQVPMISKPYYDDNFYGFYRTDLLNIKLIHIQNPHQHKLT